ncbi:MAG: hypothetical protein M3O01_06285 [Pseudomonadota bacterium]|nr:hypothetical protein [Pseudomonadota bacterium]
MKNATKPNLVESKMLAQGADCALASVLIDGLPNTVLVQLVGTPLGSRRVFSLYSVYREDTVTFDAICRFSLRPVPKHRLRPPLEQTLRRYLGTSDFRSRVIEPMMQEVQTHFGR